MKNWAILGAILILHPKVTYAIQLHEHIIIDKQPIKKVRLVRMLSVHKRKPKLQAERKLLHQDKSTVDPTPPSGSHNDWLRQAGVTEVSCATSLIEHESGWDVHATNPISGAYGIPQALPGIKMASAGLDWETNPITQLKWMKGYVEKYGGFCGAWAFWQANSW